MDPAAACGVFIVGAPAAVPPLPAASATAGTVPIAATPTAAAAATPPTSSWRCPNEVLRRLFPSHATHTLLDFLVSPPRCFARDDLLRPDDSDEYRRLLERTILVELQPLAAEHTTTTHSGGANASNAAPGHATKASGGARAAAAASHAIGTALPFDHVSLSTWLTVPSCPTAASAHADAQSTSNASSKSDGMRSLILRAIARLVSKGPNVSVLTQGYAKLDNHRNRSGIGDMYIHNTETNTVVTYLQTEPWCRLLQRTSDDLMHWLLTYTALFAELQNCCFVQLTGPAVVKVHKAIRLAQAQAGRQGGKSKQVPSDRRTEMEPTQMRIARSHSLPPALSHTAAAAVHPAPPHAAAAALHAAPSAAVAATTRAPRATFLRAGRPARRITRLPLVAPHFVPLVTPLPRSTMFYRAPIRSEVGLPQNHPFHLCPPSKRGAQRLISHIYRLAPPSGASTAGASTAPASSLIRAASSATPSALRRASSDLAAAPLRAASAATSAIIPPSRTPSTPLSSTTIAAGSKPRALHPALSGIAHDQTETGAPTSGVASALDFLPSLTTSTTAAPLAGAVNRTTSRLPPVPKFHPSPAPPPPLAFPSVAAAAAPAPTAPAASMALPTQPPHKKKRVRVKTDARKEKRRLQLESRCEQASGGAATKESTNNAVVSDHALNATSDARATLDPAAAGVRRPPPVACLHTAPPPPIAPLPPRLLALIPILESLLRRHHRCYYGYWLHMCCPWQMPRGAAPPNHITPHAGNAKASAAKDTTSSNAPPPPPSPPSVVNDGVQPMSLDSTPPQPPPSVPPFVVTPPSGAAFPSLSSHLAATSPVSSQRLPTRSANITPLSQAPSVDSGGGSGGAASRRGSITRRMDGDADSWVARRLYLTQAFDDEDDPPTPHQPGATMAAVPPLTPSNVRLSEFGAVGSNSGGVSPRSLSESFRPPSLASGLPLSQTSLRSTPSTDASAVALMHLLHASPTTPTRPSPPSSTQRSNESHPAQHASISCDAMSNPCSASEQATSSSHLALSQRSGSQRRRAKWHRRLLHKRVARASLRVSSKQTQTPSRRAQSIYASAAANSPTFLPLADLPVETLSLMTAPSSSVCAFLRCLVCRVVPLRLFGSARNRQRFLANATQFVRLRRFETATGQQMMQGIKLNEVPWLQWERKKNATSGMDGAAESYSVQDDLNPPAASVHFVESTRPKKRKASFFYFSTSAPKRFVKKRCVAPRVGSSSRPYSHQPPSHHLAQSRLFSTLLRFLMTDLILPLLRTNFYCTDSESSRHRIVYYRREVWNELVRKTMADLSGGGGDPHGVSGPNASGISHSGVEGDRSMFVRMDKVAAVSYLQLRLRDVTSTSALPMQPMQPVQASGGTGAPATAGLPSSLTASGAPIAASSSSSTLAGHGLGVAKLRLRPRKNGAMRPIVNMARGGQVKVPMNAPEIGSNVSGGRPSVLLYPPINTVLRHLFEVLRYEKEDDHMLPSSAAAVAIASCMAAPTPQMASSGTSASGGGPGVAPKPRKKSGNIMGCSVFGINAIYTRILTFAHQWKNLKPIGGGGTTTVQPGEANDAPPPSAPLYAVCVDVKHCFDTINRVKLLSILSSLLSERAYSLSRYTSLLPLFGVVRPKFLRAVAPASSIPMFLHECWRRSHTQRHAVYTDAVHRRFHDAGGLLDTLREHVYQNIVKLGGAYYHQTDGIPQGSVLSSLLCCIYLAHMEKKAILPHLIKAANGTSKRTKPAAAAAVVVHRSQSAAASTSSVQHHSRQPTHASPVKAASMVTRKRGRDDASDLEKEGDIGVRLAEDAKRAKTRAQDDERKTNAPARATSASSLPPPLAAGAAPPLVYPALHLLLRQMDDFLYVTTSLPAARKFHELMTRGFKDEYGMEINTTKTKVWFGEKEGSQDRDPTPDAAAAAAAAAATHTAASPTVARVMSWNGYLIDVPTLGISADYTRLRSEPSNPDEQAANASAEERKEGAAAAASSSSQRRRHVADRSSLIDSLTVDATRHRGLSMSRSFRRFLHPRLHPLLLSVGLHAHTQVCGNLFDNFVVSAAKLVTHANQLAAASCGSGAGDTPNQWFLMRTLLDGMEYAINLVHARFRHHTTEHAARSASTATSSRNSAAAPRFPLSNLEFRFLALHAYALIFERKQTRYKLVWIILTRMIQTTHQECLLRFEKVQTSHGANPCEANSCEPNIATADDPNPAPCVAAQLPPTQDVDSNQPVRGNHTTSSASAAAAAPILACLHRAMYATLLSERARLTPTSAPLGIVPRPTDTGEKRQADAGHINRDHDQAIAQSVVSGDMERRLVKRVRPQSAAASQQPAAKRIKAASAGQDVCSSAGSQLPHVCICGVIHAAATRLTPLQLSQLRRMRALLPHLQAQARATMQGIRF